MFFSPAASGPSLVTSPSCPHTLLTPDMFKPADLKLILNRRTKNATKCDNLSLKEGNVLFNDTLNTIF